MIKVKDLNFGYKKRKPLFKGLDFNLEAGSINGIFGMNGAGKTTFFKLMAGTLFPWSGQSEILGFPSEKRLPSMLSEIFMIAEEFYLPSINAKKYVNIHAPFYPRFDHDFFIYCMNEFGMDVTNNLQELSYGQKKKVFISFGLATNTKVLLLDEPTNGLDIPSKSQFRKIMASADTEHRSILISTHQVRDLAAIIDRIVIIDNGKIIFNYNTSDILDCISFQKIKENESHNFNVLYSEEILGGKMAICSKQAKETEIDFELLFNGVINNPEIINQEFKKSN